MYVCVKIANKQIKVNKKNTYITLVRIHNIPLNVGKHDRENTCPVQRECRAGSCQARDSNEDMIFARATTNSFSSIYINFQFIHIIFFSFHSPP